MTFDQTEIPGTQMPLLASIDCGKKGYIVRNDREGNLEACKMPINETGVDLYAVADLVRGYDMVLMEHPPLGGFKGQTRLTESCCWGQFKELYGLLAGIQVPFHTITPQVWQNEYFGFPTSKEVGKNEWKSFLWEQAQNRFPTVKKMAKDSADSFLLYRMLTALWAKDPTGESWPG
jgi:hypothetical protein